MQLSALFLAYFVAVTFTNFRAIIYYELVHLTRKESTMNNKSHLTLTDRALIEKFIAQGLSFAEIGRRIGRSTSTIAREVKAHRCFLYGENFGTFCLKSSKCHRHHVFSFPECHFCRNECRYCTKHSCYEACPDFTSNKCSRLLKAPYVCITCAHQKDCKRDKAFYSAHKAHDMYLQTLTSSRRTIHVTSEQLERINEIVVPALKKGQSINHIFSKHADEIGVSEKTLYNYIDIRTLNATNMDLPEKIRYRKRRVIKDPRTKDDVSRLGRTYGDFTLFMEQNPTACVVEMDTVKGKQDGTKKVLLTMIFRETSFMLIFLLPDGTMKSVAYVFNQLTAILGQELFCELFPVILTDNGSEFKSPEQFERHADNSIRTRIFYCDPQASWQKPQVERNHHMIRKILPKGTSFRLLTDEDVRKITCHINSVAREKYRNYTPFDLMLKDEKYRKLLSALDLHPVEHDDVCLRPSLLKTKD